MVVNSAVVLIQALRLGFKAGLNGRPPPPAPANLPRSIFLNSLKRSIRLPSSSSSTVTNSVNSNSTSIKLSFKFNALLNQLNPIFRGFGNVFRSHPSTSNYSSSPILNNLNNLRSSAKSGFTASRSSIRGSGLRPSFRPSVSHGPGLQLARNFSSTGSSFGLIINNSPLALRAFGNELEKEGRGNGNGFGERKAKASRGKGKGKSRIDIKKPMVKANLLRKSKVGKNVICLEKSEVTEMEKENSFSSVRQTELEFQKYFKEVSKEGLSEKGALSAISTTLHLALDPDLSDILVRQPLNSSSPLLDRSLLSNLSELQSLYQDHRQFLSKILKVLRSLGLINSYDPFLISFENEDEGRDDDLIPRELCLEIKFEGHKKEKILDMLNHRIGEGWVKRFEGLMLFVESGEEELNLEELVREGLNSQASSIDHQVQDHQLMDSVYSEVTYSSYLTNPPNSGTQEQEDFVQIDQDQEYHNQEEHENQDQDGFSLSQTLVIPQIQLELSNHYSSNSSPTSSSSSSPSSLGSPTISEMDELDHLDLEEFEMEEDEDEEDDLMDSRVGF